MPDKIPITDSHMLLGIAEIYRQKDLLFSRGSKIRPSSRNVDQNNTSDIESNEPLTEETVKNKILEVLTKNDLATGVIMCEVPTARDFVHSVFINEPDKIKAFTCLDPLQTWAAGDLRTDIIRGYSGLYLQPVVQHFHIYDKRAYGLYEICEGLNVPVKISFGMVGSPYADFRYCNPLDLQPVARDFPGISFIVPALGEGFYRELLMIMKQCDNIFADLSGANRHDYIYPCQASLASRILNLVNVVGTERIIFGSSSGEPLSYYNEEFANEMKQIFSNYTNEVKEKIFGKTIKDLMNDIKRQEASEKPVSRLSLKRF
jgi:predicted TIM-barrel fold metal-dependent hydrolase